MEYEKICEELSDGGFCAYTVSEFVNLPLSEKMPEEKTCVVLRHDIDGSPKKAFDIARIEMKYGLRSTFYFKTHGLYSFFEEDVQEIALWMHKNGFEIGYHYEALDFAGGNCTRALRIFEDELERMREIVPITSIAAHGNWNTPYGNVDLWDENRPYRSYNVTSAYLDVADNGSFEGHLTYASDTGMSWNIECRLSTLLKENRHESILNVLTHPVHWKGEGYPERTVPVS